MAHPIPKSSSKTDVKTRPAVKAGPAVSATRYILIATALLLPTLSLVPLGGLWLWQNGYVLWWALAALACIAIVTLLQRTLIAGALRRTPPADAAAASATGASTADAALADPTWSPLEANAWADVKVVASRVDLDKMTDLDAVVLLGRNTVDVVARRLHPTRDDAVWQFTLPEALAIAERVSRRLGTIIETNVPFGDRMTVSQFLAIYQWRHLIGTAERVYDIWRLVRLVNPATALTNEARERLSRALFQWGREHVMRGLVEAYVEEVGRAAIDLYGGRLKISHARISEVADSRHGPDDLAALARAPITVLVAGGAEARETAAALLRMVEQDQARAMVEALETRGGTAGSTAAWPLIGIDVRVSRVDLANRKHAKQLVTEIADADLVVWAPSDTVIVPDGQAEALTAIADHFKTAPGLLAPAFLPLRFADKSGAAVLDGLESNFARLEPVDIDPDAADPQEDGARLGAAVERALGHARRVKTVRLLDRLKAERGYASAGRQAISALGSAVRSIVSRGTSQRSD